METPEREVVTRAISIPLSLRRSSRPRRDLMLTTAIAFIMLGFLAHVLYVSDIGNRFRTTTGTSIDDVIQDGLDGVDEIISTSNGDDQDSMAQKDWTTFFAQDAFNATRYCMKTGRYERFCKYSPLCINRGQIVYIEGDISCDSFQLRGEKTAMGENDCLEIEKKTFGESGLTGDPVPQPRSWLKEQEESGGIRWVENMTALLAFPKSDSNIAQYSPRILFLWTLMRHAEGFGVEPIQNALLLASDHIMNQLLSRSSWHREALRAVVNPWSVPDRVLDSLDRYEGTERVQYLRNDRSMSSGGTTCFRGAILLGYLKNRVFLPSIEVPGLSKYPEDEDPERLPGDALGFRRSVFAMIGYSDTSEPLRLKRKLVYLKRGSGRSFDSESEGRLVSMLSELSKQWGFDMRVVTFEGLSFEAQVKAVENAAIAIGIHGANLVNAIFLPPRAQLVEIFPYRFAHDLFKYGSTAGLRYKSYTLTSGLEFPEISEYVDSLDCIRKKVECKVHYRSDAREMTMTEDDILSIWNILNQAKEDLDPELTG
ncbi:hypothetical protein NDN08_007859 [Rhodosorus marinus]|uniref:Glycosyltransferase 61 catalytic domain-containing protein n=1 Tax=Rhodosorus marinus TaxID=101924 RepID=A0AAV8V1J2_9RHOD|nr:hypothetical protein NDN08_007859 [Rhodosorus marinus]